jgi:tetratricopeptide (TPR) repeat protein
LGFSQVERDRETAMAADNSFKQAKYSEAVPLFAQLLSNHPGDMRYEYLYGVSRYQVGNMPADAIQHLENASKDNSTPRDVWFYLGRCYHLTYHFSEAVDAYIKFKQFAAPKQLEEWDVDLNIQQCKNAINMPDKSDKYLVHDKLIVNENDFLSLYKLDPLRDGRILTMLENYQSSADKKKNEKQFLYLEPSGTKMYYASRGVDGENSSDIICVSKKINKWERPAKVSAANSKYDESYPTSSKDGKVVYFSAKSPQSLGGYDIFKITFNSATNTWSKPENMGAPVNSPADDFLFATSTLEHCAYVTTNRDCEPGKLCVMKIELTDPTEGSINIRGKFINNDRPNELQVTIQFFNQDNWKLLGEAKVDTKSGAYSIKLPYVQRFATRIDVVGYSLLLGEFKLRFGKKIVKQQIVLNKKNTGDERFIINNSYPEDEQIILAAATDLQLQNSETNNAEPIVEQATTNKPSIANNNSTIRNKSIDELNFKSTKPFPLAVVELKPIKTFDWSAEKLQILASIKPKEDKELLAFAEEEKKKKIAAEELASKGTVKEKPKQAFNLENVTLANLESNTPRKKENVVTAQTENKMVITGQKDLSASLENNVKPKTKNSSSPVVTQTKPFVNVNDDPPARLSYTIDDIITKYLKAIPQDKKVFVLSVQKTETLAFVNVSKSLLSEKEETAVASTVVKENVPPVVIITEQPVARLTNTIEEAPIKNTKAIPQDKKVFALSVQKTESLKHLKLKVAEEKPEIVQEQIAKATKPIEETKTEKETTQTVSDEATAQVNYPKDATVKRDEYAAGLRYKLKIFENKSDSQVRSIVSDLSAKGLTQ